MPHELHIAHEKATQLAISLGYISHVDDDTLDTRGTLHDLITYWQQIMDDCGLNGADASWDMHLNAASGSHIFMVQPDGLPALETEVDTDTKKANDVNTLRDLLYVALTDLVQQSADKWSAPATTLA